VGICEFICFMFLLISLVVFVAGNGGASPKHAILFASDVPPSKVVRLIDRYLMFYIRTADRLTRTAPWVAGFEGGIEVRSFTR